MTFKTILVAGVVPLGLAACDGATGSSAPGLKVFDTSQEYFDAGEEIFALIEEDLESGNYDDPGSLQQSGSSSYFGSMYIETTSGGGAIGAMRLDTSFSNNSISGVVSNIVDFADDPVGGQLTISNGVIDRTVNVQDSFTYAADVNGTLTTSSSETVLVDGGLSGDFFNDQAHVYGVVSGSLTVDGAASEFAGEFLGER